METRWTGVLFIVSVKCPLMTSKIYRWAVTTWFVMGAQSTVGSKCHFMTREVTLCLFLICDWLSALVVSIVTGQSNCFCLSFLTLVESRFLTQTILYKKLYVVHKINNQFLILFALCFGSFQCCSWSVCLNETIRNARQHSQPTEDQHVLVEWHN